MPSVEHSRREWVCSGIPVSALLPRPLCLLLSFPSQTPHFPPDSDLLLKAARTYHRFLTWPVPYCSICQELLTFIDAELKAPGEWRGEGIRCTGPGSPPHGAHSLGWLTQGSLREEPLGVQGRETPLHGLCLCSALPEGL